MFDKEYLEIKRKHFRTIICDTESGKEIALPLNSREWNDSQIQELVVLFNLIFEQGREAGKVEKTWELKKVLGIE